VTQVLIEKLGAKPARSRRCKSEFVQNMPLVFVWEGLDEWWTWVRRTAW